MSSGACRISGFEWSIFYDWNADGVRDLTVFDDPADADVGTDHWTVHFGGAAGYDAGSAWTLPGLPALNSLDDPDYSDGYSWSLLDLTADGRLDLVVLEDPDDADVGIDHWEVYANTGSGFDTTATSFSIPTAYGPFRYGSFGSTLSFPGWSSSTRVTSS